MKKQLEKFVILALGLALWGCETAVTDLTIPYSPTLVIESFISPQDTLLFVRVLTNRPSIGVLPDTLATVTNATVTLSDGSKTVQLPFDGRRIMTQQTSSNGTVTQQGYYLSGYSILPSQLPILTGHTYTLKASAPGFNAVTATCTVPVPFSAESISAVKGTPKPLTDSGNDRNATRALSIQWQDKSGQADYYGLRFTVGYQSPGRNRTFYNSASRYAEYQSDQGKDGELLTSVRADVDYDNRVQSLITVYLAHGDQAYYDFNRTLISQNDTGNNPFAEPALVYSNVQGGLGVFSAYQLTRVQIPF